MVLPQQAVPAEDVAPVQADLAPLAGVVQLGQRCHLPGPAALLLQLRHPEAVQLHSGDFGEHLGELGLHELEARDRLAELDPVLRVFQRDVVGGQGVAERLPGRTAPRRGEHVVCDAAGRPYHPDTMSDVWRALCGEGGVPGIRLHDARRTCGTLMHMQGVPMVVISQWLGHADPAFTMRTYVHSQDDALKKAAATLQQVVTPS